jgi:hypothetical protein
VKFNRKFRPQMVKWTNDKTATLYFEECVSIRYYVYCDSNERSLVWYYERRVSDRIVLDRRLFGKMHQNLTRSNSFSQTRCERPLQRNESLGNILRMCKRVKMPMAERYPIEFLLVGRSSPFLCYLSWL